MNNHFYHTLKLSETQNSGPFVGINMVTSLDGKVTSGGKLRPGSLGGSFDRQTMNFIRSRFDAVLAGGNTVRQHPYYYGVDQDLALWRENRGLTAQPLTIILSRSGKLDPRTPVFQDPPRPPIILTSSFGAKSLAAEIKKQAQIEIVNETIHPSEICQILQTKYQVNRLLVEGGPSVNYQFIQAKLVDELFVTLAPRLVGRTADLNLVRGEEVLPKAETATLLSVYQHENELYLRYKFRW